MTSTAVLVELLYLFAVLACIALAVRLVLTTAPVWTRKAAYWVVFALVWIIPIGAFTWLDWATRPVTVAAKQLPADITVEVDEAVLRTRDGKFESLHGAFGPDVDSAQVRNAKPMFPVTFEYAEAAQLAIYPSGNQAIVAVMKDPKRAEFALSHYWGLYGITGAHGDSRSGWTAVRDSGETVHTLVAGRYFFAWIASDAPSTLAMRASVPALRSSSIPAPATTAVPVSAAALPLMTIGWTASGLISLWWLFRGANWREQLPPSHHMPAPASSLKAKLLELNFHDLPFTAEQPAKDRIEITWRQDDPRWTAAGNRRTYMLALTPDVRNHRVRARRMQARLAGAGSQLRWKAVPSFFGSASANAKGEFSLQQLETQISEVVRRSGWTWQPIAIDAPKWLRDWIE